MVRILGRTVSTYQITLHIILIALGVEVLFLLQRIDRLQEVLSARKSPIVSLSVGDSVRAISLTDTSGLTRRLDFDEPSRPYLFFVLDANCPACKKNLPHWIEVADGIADAHVEIVGISIRDVNSARDYSLEFHPPFPVVAQSDTSVVKAFGITKIPQTYLVGNNGLVLGRWEGVLTKDEILDIGKIVRNSPPSNSIHFNH